jgi:FkbM family methyltransferase
LRDKLRLLVIRVLGYVGHGSGSLAEKLWKETVCEVDGIKYAFVDSHSFLVISHEFESFMPVWLKPKKGDCLLDIGAHIGRYTLATAKVVGDEGIIVSVEPHPINYQILQRNICLNDLKNVIALNLAAWNKNCELKLFAGNASGLHSVRIHRNLGWVRVKARVMDRLCNELGLSHLEWIKIDVEGAEWEVLCGLEETIDKYKPKIVIEVFHENVDKFKKFLKEREYALIKISPCDANLNLYFFCIPLQETKS